MSLRSQLQAGAAVADVTPRESVFLFGYPNVRRWSTGVHDPLLASALYLYDGQTGTLFIAVDVVFISLATSKKVRQRLSQIVRLPEDHILISATHTHSGPITVNCLSNEHDSIVPAVDAKYVQWLEDRLVDAGICAIRAAEPAQIGVATADAAGIGTNRRDPDGPADLAVPVLMMRRQRDRSPIALMLICCMHPTVLHEDSTLISGDFPGLTRKHLQQHVVGPDCPVLYHTGPAGNQSPRHVIRANTFDEAIRLGDIIGIAVKKALTNITFITDVPIECRISKIDLPLRSLGPESDARSKLEASVRHLEALRKGGASRTQIRTAECDWFGAAETVTLAEAAADGRLAQFATACLPAEVQLIRIGKWNFVAWPGEVFVEFGLHVKARCPNTFIINYANGELQGYIVTQQAVDEGGYEASNAIFRSPDSGNLLVDATLDLLK